MHRPEGLPELSTDAVIKWAKTQPPDRTYTWQDPAFCLVGQYLAEHGSSWGTMQYSNWPEYELIAEPKPHTFGAALERAEALKALPPPALQLTHQEPSRELVPS